MAQQPIYTVSQINQYIKSLLEEAPVLSGVFVRGEISNYKAYPSGHHYFSLKDKEGAIRCVMFRREASRLRFCPENGMKVIAFGRISVYPRDGQYQLYCGELTPDGIGDLHIAFEQLKEKLFQKGYFAQDHKKPIPAYPERIALVTSPAGAAVRDMIRILGARYPLSQVIVVPVRVQGEEAAGEIAAAIELVNAENLAELIITGRGGGSMEDLWAFNEELVAKAIYNSEIPVISAVGHEPDVTIADFVADLRAATPSNAAELAVPDQNELYAWLESCGVRMQKAVNHMVQKKRLELSRLEKSRAMESPLHQIDDRRMQLDHFLHRLESGMQNRLTACRGQFGRMAAALDALSPYKVLGRGYTMARTESGEILTNAEQAQVGDMISLQLSDGALRCQVKERMCSSNGRKETEL